MELTDEQIVGLREIWCRPHHWCGVSSQIEVELQRMGLMESASQGGIHPLTHKGRKLCRELISQGQSPKPA